jgi:hypothetical protein
MKTVKAQMSTELNRSFLKNNHEMDVASKTYSQEHTEVVHQIMFAC